MSRDPFDGFAKVNPLGAEPFPVPYPDDAHFSIVSHIRGIGIGPNNEGGAVAQMTLLHCTQAEHAARPEITDMMDPRAYQGLEMVSLLLDVEDAGAIVVGLITAFEQAGQGPRFHALVDQQLAAGRQLYRNAQQRPGAPTG